MKTLLASMLFAIPIAAQAQMSRCVPANDAVKFLAEKYKEFPAGVGTISNGAGTLFLMREATGRSWTIFAYRPDNMACVVLSGTDWQDIDVVAPPEGAPS